MNSKHDSYHGEFDISDEKDSSSAENETNDKYNDKNYNDEKISVDLYDDISSTIYNCLNSTTVKNAITNNGDILRLLELQISNLLFLESELKVELNQRKNSIAFLQIISDITNLEITIKKSKTKNRIEILGERNLLIVTIINTFSNVARESLEKKRLIDPIAFEELSNQISALNNFNQTTEKSINQSSNNHNKSINPPIAGTQTNAFNSPQDLSSLNNLSKLGLLPQHPAANPNFYPYLTKPLLIPKIKKILAGFLIGSLFLIIMTAVTSLFVKGNIELVAGKGKISISMSGLSNWLLIGVTIALIIFFSYNLLKPIKLKREIYHTSYFVLILLLIWIVFISITFFSQITPQFIKAMLEGKIAQLYDGKPSLSDGAVAAFMAFPNFKLFSIFSIITASFLVIPAVLVVLLILINPRLDRNKIVRANTEYQNAIQAALSGQKYEIDAALFDSDEPDNNKKTINNKQ